MSAVYGFIGLGLIGGSIAKGLKKAEPDCRIYAYMRNKTKLEIARGEGVVDAVLDSSDDCRFAECKVIFLCAPVEICIECLSGLKPYVREGMIVTDAGSTKSSIEKAALELGIGRNFIGGHPMAGSEKSGYEHSDAVMLENIYYMLCPTSETPPEYTRRMADIVRELKANPFVIQASEHDKAVATISHLPHLVAASLVNLVHRTDGPEQTMRRLAAGGFKDITRIASSSPVMWQQIFSSNREMVLGVLRNYIESLEDIENALKDDDMAAIHELFVESGEYRSTFADAHGLLEAQYSFSVRVEDKPGAISVISAILAADGISIKNIGINHNRESGSGALRIEFYDASSCASAGRRLAEYNYEVIFDSGRNRPAEKPDPQRR